MEENRTLLIVDDEPEILKGYTQFLSPQETVVARKSSRRLYGTGPAENNPLEPYRLLLAQSGEEALRLFQEEFKQGRRVAAGFFDVKLGGGMDGLATIHAIKSIDPDIHCVVVTAYHDRSVDEINQIFGEDFKDQWDYLNKPFTQSEIIQKARQMTAAWNRKKKVESLSQQLVKTERIAAIGQVARGVGHEFSNILMRIMGKIDLALGEKDLAKIKEHLEVALKASERAGVIVRNLQSFSRTEPSFQFDSVATPMEEALTLISHELVKNSVTLEKDFKTTPQFRMDTGGLAQVFLNLLINAIHAMPAGGKLKISIDSSAAPESIQRSNPQGSGTSAGVAVRVSDTGSGIADDVLPKIFDFAFSTKGDKGSGLGLSVSKEIVEAQGGSITVKTQVGKGTEFTVWLPVTVIPEKT